MRDVTVTPTAATPAAAVSRSPAARWTNRRAGLGMGPKGEKIDK